MSSENKQDHPSMVGGHVKYVQGAVSSTLGYESGEATKRDAINEMRAAGQDSSNDAPTQSNVLGSIEKKAGELVGCEGMEKEGAQRTGAGSEETSGTG